jgi:hypothetical protein
MCSDIFAWTLFLSTDLWTLCIPLILDLVTSNYFEPMQNRLHSEFKTFLPLSLPPSRKFIMKKAKATIYSPVTAYTLLAVLTMTYTWCSGFMYGTLS